ncbi:hypothetical protein K438DRAFT_2116114 [Mycena galopus ATCC 62051]|nr:hypothetical protein K438DRAFT_2116114 [Mycena galopus ATCC 62051]
MISYLDLFNVASIQGLAYQDSGWLPELSQLEHNLVEVGDGWVRLNSEPVEQIEEIFRKIYCGASGFAFWLTQANHIFDRLKIMTGQEDYGTSIFNSLEPSGAQPLSTDEAKRLGFPTTDLILEVQGMYLVESLYSGLRQLYQGKGFDAYTQDVARKLGYPLYQVSEQFTSRVEEQDKTCGDDSSGSASTDTKCIIVSDAALAPDNAALSLSAYTLIPSTGWTIVMSVLLALMLTLGMLRLYSCLYAART